ncbi:MAG: hypothetical protein LCH58_00395 [Bacteroidetes bacterium]|uniref:hypothetical protein n=1 Tax=Phnomibacter sp. TaxID=2836217 RepID=UPI002FDDCCE1|nr:hypothetical protein [Bacteroidota bacterium]
MRKLVYILLLGALTACHKELVKYPVNSLESKVVLTLKKQIPVAEFDQLDFSQLEKIAHPSADIVACKIPFYNEQDSLYSFVLVNVSNNVVGSVFRNDIAYTTLHGGNFPVAVRNLNYATGVLQEYSLRGGLNPSAPSQSIINRLGIPAVTTSGVYSKTATGGAERLTSIESYIFCGLLGMATFDAALTDWKTPKTKLKVQYYNPYCKNEELHDEGSSNSFLEWDVQLK